MDLFLKEIGKNYGLFLCLYKALRIKVRTERFFSGHKYWIILAEDRKELRLVSLFTQSFKFV